MNRHRAARQADVLADQNSGSHAVIFCAMAWGRNAAAFAPICRHLDSRIRPARWAGWNDGARAASGSAVQQSSVRFSDLNPALNPS